MKQHFIYVIGRQDGPVKVGITSSPGGRLSAIQTGCPFHVSILHLTACRDRSEALLHERSFHEICDDKRLAGEWFDMDAELAVECVETGFEIEAHFSAQ